MAVNRSLFEEVVDRHDIRLILIDATQPAHRAAADEIQCFIFTQESIHDAEPSTPRKGNECATAISRINELSDRGTAGKMRAFAHFYEKDCAEIHARLGGWPDRQVKPESRSLPERRLNLNSAAVRAGDAPDRRQSETSSFGSGGEERTEDAAEIRFADALAIIRDFYDRFSFSFVQSLVLRQQDVNPDLAIVMRSLNRVDDQIQHGI